MARLQKLPIALTIAGSDSGGGAGVQADLKTFASLDVHGTTAITCLTAQNPEKVIAVEPVSAAMLRKQIEAVFAELPPKAAKTGMLYSAELIATVADIWKATKTLPLTIDPVMISTSGRRLLEESAISALKQLLPLAALVTPNVAEAEVLLGCRISDLKHLRQAARDLNTQFGCAALVKGGHLRDGNEAVDFYFDGKTELMLSAPYVKNIRTHGTGCVYSAAITAWLAQGCALPTAVERGKQFITKAIADSKRIGRHFVLG